MCTGALGANSQECGPTHRARPWRDEAEVGLFKLGPQVHTFPLRPRDGPGAQGRTQRYMLDRLTCNADKHYTRHRWFVTWFLVAVNLCVFVLHCV